MTDDREAAGGEEESAAEATELFGIKEVGDATPCRLFQRFEELKLEDVKKWLLEKTPMNKILWDHGKTTEHGTDKRGKKRNPRMAISSKLMYCWLYKALDKERITEEELKAVEAEFIRNEPSLLSPGVSSSPTSPSPSSPASVGSPTLTSDQVFNEYTGTSVVLEQQAEEEESLDDGTKYTGYSHINVALKDAIFYTKTFNIENQIGACFKRISVLHKFYGKYSKAMVDDAMENGTVFPAIW
jgi:hypothetical protein